MELATETIGLTKRYGSLTAVNKLDFDRSAALGTFGIFIALFISAPILSVFSNQAWILTYVPGNGVSGTLESISSVQGIIIYVSKSVSTGTDSIAANLINYVLHPHQM